MWMNTKWMVRLAVAAPALALLLLAGCGGGGGGGGIALSGTVLSVISGIPPSRAATVTAGGAAGQTSVADGTFMLQVPSGTASITIDATDAGLGVFTYTFPPVTEDTDLGFLYVGPLEVTVTGKVVDAQTLDPLEGVLVTVLARNGLTAADGTFTIGNVALAEEWFVQWAVSFQLDGYYPREVPLAGVPIGGVLTLQDLLLAPESGTEPPPQPSNIWGLVTEPGGDGSGVLVKLILRADGTEVAATLTGTLTGGALNQYGLWVPVGEYRLEFYKPSDTLRATADVDLTDLDEPVRVDVTLN
jgi:hypothetical protein